MNDKNHFTPYVSTSNRHYTEYTHDVFSDDENYLSTHGTIYHLSNKDKTQLERSICMFLEIKRTIHRCVIVAKDPFVWHGPVIHTDSCHENKK